MKSLLSVGLTINLDTVKAEVAEFSVFFFFFKSKIKKSKLLLCFLDQGQIDVYTLTETTKARHYI